MPPLPGPDGEFYGPGLYLEDVRHKGWLTLNTGPVWHHMHPSGDRDWMGGWRYCWTDQPTPPYDDPNYYERWDLPYARGAPGYFDVVSTEEPCPE